MYAQTSPAEARFREERRRARTEATAELRRRVNEFVKRPSASAYNSLQAQMLRLQDVATSEGFNELEAALAKDWEEGADAPSESFWVTREELPVLSEGLRHLDKNVPCDAWSQDPFAYDKLSGMRKRLRGLAR